MRLSVCLCTNSVFPVAHRWILFMLTLTALIQEVSVNKPFVNIFSGLQEIHEHINSNEFLLSKNFFPQD